jgi:multidrug resistance efflux pump
MKPCALLFLLALAGCSAPPGDGHKAAPRPPAAVAQGVVESEAGLIRVLSPRDGVVDQVLAVEGDSVSRGQPLAQIQDRQARLGLEVTAAELADRQAQAEVAATKAQGAAREARRLGVLAAADAATRQDAEQAATAAAVAAGEHRQALAALQTAQARRQLGAYEVEVRDVRAPVSGRVVRRVVAAGAFVSAGAPLFVVEPDGPHVVRAELDEAFADRVKPGMTALVTRQYQQGVSYRARVVRVADVLAGAVLPDESTARADARVVTVVLGLPAGADLRIGQRVLVRFEP